MGIFDDEYLYTLLSWSPDGLRLPILRFNRQTDSYRIIMYYTQENAVRTWYDSQSDSEVIDFSSCNQTAIVWQDDATLVTIPSSGQSAFSISALSGTNQITNLILPYVESDTLNITQRGLDDEILFLNNPIIPDGIVQSGYRHYVLGSWGNEQLVSVAIPYSEIRPKSYVQTGYLIQSDSSPRQEKLFLILQTDSETIQKEMQLPYMDWDVVDIMMSPVQNTLIVIATDNQLLPRKNQILTYDISNDTMDLLVEIDGRIHERGGQYGISETGRYVVISLAGNLDDEDHIIAIQGQTRAVLQVCTDYCGEFRVYNPKLLYERASQLP